MMRKLTAMLLALALLLTAACASASEEDVTGTWVMDSLVMGQAEIAPFMVGMDYTIRLNGDGTWSAAFTIADEAGEWRGTWTCADGRYTLTTDAADAETMVLVLEDGRLKNEDELGTMTFVREEEARAVPAAPNPVSAENEEAFLGTWQVSAVNLFGLYLQLDALADALDIPGDMTLTVTPGRISVAFDANTLDVAAVFRDGGLDCVMDGPPARLILMDNGSVCLEGDPGSGESMTLYFVRAE